METQSQVPAQAPREPKPPSTAWYIAPYVGALLFSIFGAVVGGVLGWAVVKDRDAQMGRKILVPHTVIAVGIAIVATVVLWLAVFGTLFVAGEAARQVATGGSAAAPSTQGTGSGPPATTPKQCSAVVPSSDSDSGTVLANLVCANLHLEIEGIIPGEAPAIDGGTYEVITNDGYHRIITLNSVNGDWQMTQNGSPY